MYVITKTTDDKHLGETLEHIEIGNIITFKDGSVFRILELFKNDNKILLINKNYIMTIEEK